MIRKWRVSEESVIWMKPGRTVAPSEGMKPAKFQGVRCIGFCESAPQTVERCTQLLRNQLCGYEQPFSDKE
ncbi:hypothetical protein Y1Q_0006563 [Alligator mississippiensis]|uniref:Uncharacterized protein n=1 Tax=Alligator mississippiensis TaxID=8496 RepID=A0A151NTY7_ALLMI|nr:hypothetical protein Y1Q_0006563 [Alligator mississippiensis]